MMGLRRGLSTAVAGASRGGRVVQRQSRRRSGIQREVLGVYRNLLRAAKQKDAKTVDLVREKFRADATSVTRFEFQKIEHLIRKGNKYIKLLRADSVKGLTA